MRTLKKLFLVIIASLSLNACSLFGPKSSASSASSSVDTTNQKVEELNNLFNAERLSMTLHTILPDYDQDVPSIHFYADDDMFVQEDLIRDDVKEMITPTAHYVEGNGYKAKIEENNASYFYFEINFNEYINFTKVYSKGAALEFRLNYKKLTQDYKLLVFKTLENAVGVYGLTLDDMTYVASYVDDKVTAISVAFMQYIPALGEKTAMVIAYVVNGYDDSVTKYNVDFSKYYDVNGEGLEFIKGDIECLLEVGEHDVHYAYWSVQYDPVTKNTVPENAVICRIEAYVNYKTYATYYIHFSEVEFDEATGECTFYLGGKEFKFNMHYTLVS